MEAIRRKEQAIALRQEGNTYSEIAKVVPVSRATLSVWLRHVPVPASYAEKLRTLKHKAREKGWEARREERRSRTRQIQEQAQQQAIEFLNNPLWLVGLTLYWAEGSKEKPWGRGTPITFTNMDPDTLLLFREWCQSFLGVKAADFKYNLYIHDTRKSESANFAKWWASCFNVPDTDIHLYYKRARITHVRRNDSDGYHGVFRLEVRRSVDLNRRISGWTLGMIDSLKSSSCA